MENSWYYLREGQEYGPFPYAVLQVLARKGDLMATDQLRAGTAGEWRLAADFPDLFVTVEPRSVFLDYSSLKGLTMALGIDPAESGQDPILGRDIGGVRIIRLIAEGGMGRVYEGRQEKPNRTVAVKVMRPGLTSPSVLKRFEYEAEVLGRLQHPGIAHIYSVGVHQFGGAAVPYFVMEYIADARSLTKYADDLKLPTRQRLDLFRSVCDAVAHGHQKGVIHRDLKPSNILVDATGQPKVIDFGVARATDSDMALTTMQTDVGQLIGTLQYMSPEQFDADPNDIDVRSDVYALGVILYELLAGKMPYDLRKKAIYEVMRIVKEEDPTPLPTVNRALNGDVAVIAGKCLEKDRGQRYSSAGEVGADIGRYLTGEPIAASPPGFLDGLVRAARRHKAAAAAVVVGLAGLATTAVGTSLFAVRAERQRGLAIAERDRANAAESRLSEQLYASNIFRIDKLLTDSKTHAQNDDLSLSMRKQAHALSLATRDLILKSPLPFELTCLLTQFDGVDNALKGLPTELCHAFSATTRQLATGHADGTVRLWPLAAASKRPIILCGPVFRIRQVFFSGDGRRVACDDTASIHVWESSTGEQLAVLDDQESTGGSSWDGESALNYDGKLLANGKHVGDGLEVTVWDVASTTVVKRLKTAAGWANTNNSLLFPQFSEDGSRLAITVRDALERKAELVVWDVPTGRELLKQRLPTDLQHGRLFSVDGRKILVSEGDFLRCNTVRAIDIASGTEAFVIKADDDLEGIEEDFYGTAFVIDGTRIMTLERGLIHFWDAATGQEVETIKTADALARQWPGGNPLGLIADGSCVLLHGPRVLSCDVSSGEVRTELTGLDGRVSSVAFSPDSSRLAAGSWDNTVRLWNAGTGEEIATLLGHADRVLSVAFSPDGVHLASGSADGSVRLWDLRTGDEKRRFTIDGERVAAVAFCANGTRLAAAASDSKVRVWHVLDGQESKVFDGDEKLRLRPQYIPHFVPRVAFSPDGRHVAWEGHATNNVSIWNTLTGEKVLSLSLSPGESISPQAFSSDCSRLVTVGNRCRIWEVPSGRPLGEPSNLLGSVSSESVAAFSADRSWLAVAEGEQETGVRLIRLDTMDATCGVSYGRGDAWHSEASLRKGDLVDASSHAGAVKSMAFSPDGSQLATGSTDGTARLWGRTSTELRAARAQVEEIRRRLQARVDGWFTPDSRTAVARLSESKAELTADEYAETANMVLKRCVAERHKASPR